MRAVITLDVPDFQIGQEVTVYFPDTMQKHGICEAVETIKPKLSREWFVCECGSPITVEVDGEPLHKSKYCCECGKGLEWS